MALYEHYWDCPACETKGISALRKRKCPNCGYSKTPQDAEIRSQVEITDEVGIKLARGEPHWECSSCGSVNLGSFETCESCGNPKEADDPRNVVRELGTTPPPVYHPPDEDQQFYEEAEVKVEVEPVSPRTLSPAAFDYLEPAPSKRSWLSPTAVKTGLIALVVLLVVGILGWALFDTTEMEGTVTGFSWTRQVVIEEYRTVHDSGWALPFGAYNVRSEERVHHYDPIYEEREEVVHHPKTCYQDLGTGAEESYDCSYDTVETFQEKVDEEPVYETWYEYDIDKWIYERTESSSGNDRNPYWPNYTLYLDSRNVIGAERVGSRVETYVVHFEAVNDKNEVVTYGYRTSESEWYQFALNKVYTIKVNHFGAITNNPLEEILKK